MAAVTRTVGKTGRDYSTLGAAVADIGAGLSEADDITFACYNDDGTAIVESPITIPVMSGSLTIVAAAGTGAQGHPNDHRTRGPAAALGFDPALGVAFLMTAAFGHLFIVPAAQGNRFDVIGVQIRTTGARGGGWNCQGLGTGSRQDGVLLVMEATNANFGDWRGPTGSSQTIENCVIVTNSSDREPIRHFFSHVAVRGTTLIATNAANTIRPLNAGNSSDGSVLDNCAVFGFASPPIDTGAGLTARHNGTDLAAGTFGGTNTVGSLATADQFESAALATLDLRVKTGSGLIGAGDLALGPATDILGQTRVSPSTIGAFEVLGGAPVIEATGAAVGPAPAVAGQAAAVVGAAGALIAAAAVVVGLATAAIEATGAVEAPGPAASAAAGVTVAAAGAANGPAALVSGQSAVLTEGAGTALVPAAVVAATADVVPEDGSANASGAPVGPAPVATGQAAVVVGATGAAIGPAATVAAAGASAIEATAITAGPASNTTAEAALFIAASGSPVGPPAAVTGQAAAITDQSAVPPTAIAASLITSTPIEARRGMTRDNPLIRQFNSSPLTLVATVRDAAGTPVDLTGFAFRWALAPGDGRAAPSEAVATLTSAGGGVVVTNAGAGVVEVRAPASLLAGLVGAHRWQLIATDPAAQDWVVATGQVWLMGTF